MRARRVRAREATHTRSSMLLCLSLWLDLRGKPCANDLTVLLDLYAGVRKRFDKAGLPPPAGAVNSYPNDFLGQAVVHPVPSAE